MHRIKQTLAASTTKLGGRRLCNILKPPQTCGTDPGLAAAAAGFSSKLIHTSVIDNEVVNTATKLQGIWRTAFARQYSANTKHTVKDVHGANAHLVPKIAEDGIYFLSRGKWARECMASVRPSLLVNTNYKGCSQILSLRPFSSTASERPGENNPESKKDVSTIEDPFDSPTYNIPEKPVTFVEGASYSFIILAGLAVAAVAAYAVFKELIFEPKEYKIFGKALERVKNDGQVKVRIGTPISGYGQESRNRAARQRIPNRMWTDENGTEHVEINFHIRGPRGGGIVYAVMHKGKADKQWKYTSLIVQIRSPSTAQLILESYIPA